MAQNQLQDFLDTVLSIKTTSFSLLGVRSTESQVIYDLFQIVKAYVASYENPSAKSADLDTLAEQVRGQFSLLRTLSVISSKKFEILDKQLDNLQTARSY